MESLRDDYISRKTFIERVKDIPFWGSVAVLIAGQLPTTDMRPVVLCRDCKCYRQSSFVDKHMECARSGFPVHSVDFCSRGEKREEN